jgi:hypothetical protein
MAGFLFEYLVVSCLTRTNKSITMKTNYCKFLFCLLLLAGMHFTAAAQTTCNWKNRNASVYFYDSCMTGFTTINAFANIDSVSNNCLSYEWKVNGTNISGNASFNYYQVTQNGIYDFCVKLIDTCNNCDTTFCSRRMITCISNTNCIWKSRNATTTFWDSCQTGFTTINGNIDFGSGDSCLKYQWKVNGVVMGGNTSSFYHAVSQNGIYNLCVKVTDTCNFCDTTYCSSRMITCIPANCNWKAKGVTAVFQDSCSNNPPFILGYLTNSNNACYNYQWKVNGVNAGTNQSALIYYFTQNGTYNICVKVTDSCNGCDTTFCSTRVITCVSNTCNWKSRNPTTSFSDTCKNNTASFNGYLNFGTSSSCFKYQWKVNGAIIGVNTNYLINYPFNYNGTYNICVKVTDTCNNCDTTFCSTRVITCLKSTCNWKSRNPTAIFWDSCTTALTTINGYIYFDSVNTSCFKYKWKINGTPINTGNNNYFGAQVVQNGTYNLCVTVTDTCNGCDTTFCSSRVITCINKPPCNWKARNPVFSLSDSCLTGFAYVDGYVSFSGSSSCYRYKWKVNGATIGGNTSYFSHSFSQNGTYNICVTVTDTCNNCDTTFCDSIVINCGQTNTCNWNSRNPAVHYVDSCDTTNALYSLQGNVTFGSGGQSCYFYEWKVNGVTVSNSSSFYFPVTLNGNYYVCVDIVDTCNGCDTTICTLMSMFCIPKTACNWKRNNTQVAVWDSCFWGSTDHTVNGFIASNANCLKYHWTVDGNFAGDQDYMMYFVTQNDTYDICVTVTDTCNNCDTTICKKVIVDCGPTGVKKTEPVSKLSVYPNPGSGIFNLSGLQTAGTFSISDLTGMVLESGELNRGEQVLDLGSYPDGLYLLYVQTGDSIVTRKLLIRRE